jgi:hypothetical protein
MSAKLLGVYARVKTPLRRADEVIRVGRALANDDGTMSVQLDALPVDGELLIIPADLAAPSGAKTEASDG